MIIILTCKLGDKNINCIDGKYNKEQLKKWSSKNILKCPVCGKSYEYCHGVVKMPYFRHKDKVTCTDKYAERETEEHLLGKRDLYEWISRQEGVSNVILEAWIPETKQRPDIMFDYNSEKWVIEYQCSPIVKEYFERHDLYQAAGIRDIWICGAENYLKSNMRVKVLEEYCDGYYNSYTKQFILGYDPDLQYIVDKTSISKSLNILLTHFKDNFDRCCVPIADVIFDEGEFLFKYIKSTLDTVKSIKNRNCDKEMVSISEHYFLSQQCFSIKKILEHVLTKPISNITVYPKLCKKSISIDYAISINSPWGAKRYKSWDWESNKMLKSKRLPLNYFKQQHCYLSKIVKDISSLQKKIIDKHLHEFDLIQRVIHKYNKIHLIVGFNTHQRRQLIHSCEPYSQYFKDQVLGVCDSHYDFIRALTTHISNNCKSESSVCIVILPQSIRHYIPFHRYHEDIIINYLQLFGFNNVTVVHDRENIFEYIPQEDI